MIQLISVTKEYNPQIIALQDLTLDIEEGEFVFLVGPSGSGKTTLIKLLIREELPSQGKIYFEDDDITKYKRKQVYSLRRKIGVIFQDYKLIPELDAYENVAFAMEAAGKSDKEIAESVPYLLDIVGLSNRMNFFPRQLSGGEKQRVAIARAMANNPKLLIADEPTGNLDPDSAWDIVQILSKINNWGTTVLMSTHGSDIVNSLHKRVLRMQDGKLIRDDYKGSYDEVDEFSLKVLSASDQKLKNGDQDSPLENKAPEKELKEKMHLPPPPDHDDKQSQKQKPKKKKQQPQETEAKPKQAENKSKKIKFSTKKNKKLHEERKQMEEKILEKMESAGKEEEKQ